MVTFNKDFWAGILVIFLIISFFLFNIYLLIKVHNSRKIEKYEKDLSQAKNDAYDYLINNVRRLRKLAKKMLNDNKKKEVYEFTDYIFVISEKIEKANTIEEIDRILNNFNTMVNAIEYNNQ